MNTSICSKSKYSRSCFTALGRFTSGGCIFAYLNAAVTSRHSFSRVFADTRPASSDTARCHGILAALMPMYAWKALRAYERYAGTVDGDRTASLSSMNRRISSCKVSFGSTASLSIPALTAFALT